MFSFFFLSFMFAGLFDHEHGRFPRSFGVVFSDSVSLRVSDFLEFPFRDYGCRCPSLANRLSPSSNLSPPSVVLDIFPHLTRIDGLSFLASPAGEVLCDLSHSRPFRLFFEISLQALSFCQVRDLKTLLRSYPLYVRFPSKTNSFQTDPRRF